MASRTFPEGPQLPLDADRIRTLLCSALSAAVRDLSGTDVSGGEWLVFRPGDGNVTWTTTRLPAPQYRATAVWDRIDSIWKSPEFDALTEYLWSRGTLAKTLSQDGDGVPTRESWERFVWGDLVHMPLLALLPRAATEDLVRHGRYEPWRVDEQALAGAADEIADNLCFSARTVTAWCPTIGLHLPGGETLMIEPGVRLIPWTPEGRCLFLSRYHDQYLDDDMSSWGSQALIEIRTRVAELTEDAARMAIASIIDRVKWSLQSAANKDAPIEEGPVISRSPSGWRARTLRRGDTLMRTRSIPTIDLMADLARAAQELSQDLACARQATTELDGALWLFGRSCNASLPRDVLLDAALGLEMLLVPGPGEARYRFSLHGMTMIRGKSSETLDTDLRKIYKMRSEAAHGAANDPRAFAAIAPRSRFLLGRAIQSAVALINSGELDVRATKGDIGNAVERLVRAKLAAATS
jgi:hypothetical protein